MYRVIKAATSTDSIKFLEELKLRLKKIIGDNFKYTPCKIVKNSREYSLRIYNSGDAYFTEFMSEHELNQLINNLCEDMGISNDSVYVWKEPGARYGDNGYIEVVIVLDKDEMRKLEKERAYSKPGREFAVNYLNTVESKFNIVGKIVRGTKNSISVSLKVPNYEIEDQLENLAKSSQGFIKLSFEEADNGGKFAKYLSQDYVGWLKVVFERS